MTTPISHRRLFPLLGAALVLAACGKDSAATAACDGAAPADAAAPPDFTVTPDLVVPPALVRVVNALPGSPVVDLYLHPQEQPFATNVIYGTSTLYVPVAPGLLNIDARPAGTDSGGFPWFNTPPIVVQPGEVVTLALGGTVSAGGAVSLRPGLSFTEGFTPAAAGAARVRVVHASPDAPALNVDIGNTGSPQASAVANWTDSGGEGISVPSGKLTTTVTVSGGQPAAFLAQFTLPPLADRANMFLFVVGSTARLPREPNGLALLLVGSTGGRLILQDPAVHVLHAVPDAAGLDVYSTTSELSANLAFGALSSRIQVAPGAYTLDFFAHDAGNMRPAGNPLFSSAKVTLAAGQRYLFAASGYQVAGNGRPAAAVTVLQEAYTLDATRPYFALHHAAADAGSLDAGPLANNALASTIAAGLAWKSASPLSGVVMPAGAYTLGVAKSGANLPIGKFPISFANGNRLLGVFAGSLTPMNGEPSFRLFTIDTTAWPWTLATLVP